MKGKQAGVIQETACFITRHHKEWLPLIQGSLDWKGAGCRVKRRVLNCPWSTSYSVWIAWILSCSIITEQFKARTSNSRPQAISILAVNCLYHDPYRLVSVNISGLWSIDYFDFWQHCTNYRGASYMCQITGPLCSTETISFALFSFQIRI